MPEPLAPRESSDPIEHLFRRHHARMVAALTRVFGSSRLDLVEDVVQDALVAALRTWPYRGIPDRPDAWLIQVARNRALDLARREKLAAEQQDALARWGAARGDDAPASDGHEIADDQLRMIFTCCHPSLAPEARVALTLKTLCGLSVAEIARALLAEEPAIAQRLVRAKASLRAIDAPFEVPGPAECDARLDSVLEVLYLLFNEGYGAAAGDSVVRADLAHEALRLITLVAADPRLARPRVRALRALFLLQSSRLVARQGADGELLTLARQDRSRWDHARIAEGMREFERSIEGDELSPFHVEAAIAIEHARAPSASRTDWRAILGHYDVLCRLTASPIARLNRVVAVAKVHGPVAALAELDVVGAEPELARYHLVDAVRGFCLWTLGDRAAAAAAFDRAADAGGSEPERALLRRRAERCRAGAEVDESLEF